MAGTHLHIGTNADQVLDTFARLAMADQQRTLWEDIGEYLELATRARFELEVAPDGTPWEPLDPAYQARKPRRQDQILVLDAFLRDHMSYDASSGGVDYGSGRIYAATHHYGDPDRGIPERQILGLSDDDTRHVLELAQEHLQGIIDASA